MNAQETTTMLEDRKVNVKAKLALLWIALMFFYIYNDLFSLWQPGPMVLGLQRIVYRGLCITLVLRSIAASWV